MADLVKIKKSVTVIKEQMKDFSFLEKEYEEGMMTVFNNFDECSFAVSLKAKSFEKCWASTCYSHCFR